MFIVFHFSQLLSIPLLLLLLGEPNIISFEWILIDEFIGTTSLGNSFFVQSSGLK
jgi:hypothetical protein